MKKWFSASVASVMTLSLLSACSSNNSPKTDTTKTDASAATKTDMTAPAADPTKANSDVKGKISFLTNRTDMIDKEYKDYETRFKQKYPGVVGIDFEATPGDYDQAAKIRLASGELPDVMFIPTIPNTDLPKYFAPLDDLGLDEQIYFKDIKMLNGKVYGIATGANTSGIVYNKQAFAKAGITAPPKTLDEFYADCDKLKAAGIIPLASNFKDKWPLGSFANDLTNMFYGSQAFSNERIKSDTPYTMDGPYGKAASILKTMNEKGYLEKDINSTNWEQSKKDIAQGKFAMYFLGNWVINQIVGAGATSEDVGFFPFPRDNSGQANAILGPDWIYAVNKNSKNLPAAMAFVKWMLTESGYYDFAGFIPTIKTIQPKLPQLSEFNSFNPKFLEAIPDDPKAIDVQNKAQIDIAQILQDFVLAKDPKSVLDASNKKWADAKKALGK